MVFRILEILGKNPGLSRRCGNTEYFSRSTGSQCGRACHLICTI